MSPSSLQRAKKNSYLEVQNIVCCAGLDFAKENLLGNWRRLHNLSTERGGSPVDATASVRARATSVPVKIWDGNRWIVESESNLE